MNTWIDELAAAAGALMDGAANLGRKKHLHGEMASAFIVLQETYRAETSPQRILKLIACARALGEAVAYYSLGTELTEADIMNALEALHENDLRPNWVRHGEKALGELAEVK